MQVTSFFKVSKMLARAVTAALSGALFLLAPIHAQAAKAETYVAPFARAALGGYDAVSYFNGTPQKGDEANQVAFKGATYLFANSANAAKFKANPATYAPQYGGYCAWAAAQGKTAPGDPKFWKIVGGKLYLNFNADVQRKWEKDIPGFITKADANWPKILK